MIKSFSKENYVIKHYPDKIRQIVNMQPIEDAILEYKDRIENCKKIKDFTGIITYLKVIEDLEKILKDMVK